MPCARRTSPALVAVLSLVVGCSPCPTIDAAAWNDPEASRQWYLEQLHVPPLDATGFAEVRVAVIDDGFELDHPDVAPSLLVEDRRVLGVDLLDGDDDPSLAGERVPNVHGTACASLIGARSNDGIGLAGLCPTCRVLPIRARDFDTVRSVLPLLSEAIDWAIAHDARVLSVSDGALPADVDEPLRAEIEAALERAEAAGLVVVASAGNDARRTVRFPASATTVLAVAATDEDGSPAAFTSSGPEVDVAAPGECVWAAELGAGHAVFRGTSASAPIVAALAGVILAREPGLDAAAVRARITSTARPITGASDLGRGLVDFAAALSAL